MPTDEPIWKREPTTWKVADTYGTDLIRHIITEAGITDVPVRYQFGGNPKSRPLSVTVHAHLDGFLVNAYDRGCGFGPDPIPVGPGSLGEEVPNRNHPVDQEWLDDIRPRLAEAIGRAVTAVRAHRDGTVCPHEATMLNGKAEITRKCRRPSGHTEHHSDQAVEWDADGNKIR